jgi:hypothetical protein
MPPLGTKVAPLDGAKDGIDDEKLDPVFWSPAKLTAAAASAGAVFLFFHRGRDPGFPGPPAQIRT